MENANEIEKKYMTQQEVADLFCVKPGTVKNWRDAGHLDYFQVPGSSRVIYPAETVNNFEQKYINKAKTAESNKLEIVKKQERQIVSSNRIKNDWRI